jgi:hypothetical protein
VRDLKTRDERGEDVAKIWTLSQLPET